jgi:hypothetical protein
VRPTAKKLPEATFGVNEVNEQLSAAVGAVQVTTLPQALTSLVTVMYAGTPVITGFWLSATVTVNVEVATLP